MASTTANSSAPSARNAGEGSELLDLRNSESSEKDTPSSESVISTGGTEAAYPKVAEIGNTPSGDGLSEALKAERQKQLLEPQLKLSRKRLLKRAFSEAEGRTGGDGRGSFFQVFRSMLWDCFRPSTSKDGGDVLEPQALLPGVLEPAHNSHGRAGSHSQPGQIPPACPPHSELRHFGVAVAGQ
jgi:hypothetical protein